MRSGTDERLAPEGVVRWNSAAKEAPDKSGAGPDDASTDDGSAICWTVK